MLLAITSSFTKNWLVKLRDSEGTFTSCLRVKLPPVYLTRWKLYTRGGVEDTRLEAKAKDTKKIQGQGQGQPFRGQNLSRPRTGMFEAKAKDRGHRRKRSPKKKGRQKYFSGDLQFIGVPKIFD